MRDREASIIPGQEIFAVTTGSNRPTVLKVEVVTDDGRVVLSPNRRTTVITDQETIINGGVVEQFKIAPQDQNTSDTTI